ncbi:MAG: N-6 DNA methylase, partial [Muribaculaceae bacterium]|nr:N-6 DNA methylase [Muribaculaceae bacterium]
MAYNRLQTMRDNIEAIRLVLRLGVEKRTAHTAEEREILRKYAGFGGLKCILNDANELADAAKWSKSDIDLFVPTVELRQLIHDYSKDEREFAQYMDSLKTSVLSAFYTPAPIVDAIADSLKRNGVEIRRFLEPSAGQGAFIDSFLKNENYPGTEALAFEKDILTGKILKALHPSITTEITGFEKIDDDFNGYFDVACSNIPFGDFAVADPKYATSKEIAYRQATKAIHNYFFLKALDQVREGGLVAFIASQGVMNSASPFIRMELMKRADLVTAIRLPNNTFSENAGTDVGSDLIILQKHSGKKVLSEEEEFFIQSVVDRQTKVSGNKFFQAFPQNVICTDAKVGTDQYGKPAINYTHKDGVNGIAHELRDALNEWLRIRLDKNLYESNAIKYQKSDSIKPVDTITSSVKEDPVEKLTVHVDRYGDYDVEIDRDRIEVFSPRTLNRFTLTTARDAGEVVANTNNIQDIVTREICRHLDGAFMDWGADEPYYDEDPYGRLVQRGTVRSEIWNLEGVFNRIAQKQTTESENGKTLPPKIDLKNGPILKQYQDLKKKHPDAVLLFRVGDFYECFGKDAVKASEILGITLTRRQSGVDSRIELAGFPQNALDTYLPKLVRAGQRVAICEQLEDPKQKTTKEKKTRTTRKSVEANSSDDSKKEKPKKEDNKEAPAKTRNASGIVQTPLMKQYEELKKEHPDALLLFKVGDFYETFGNDAIEISDILDITLVRRMNGKAGAIELAGFPKHALDTYLPKLVNAGKRTALCDWTDDLHQQMKVVEMVSPGQKTQDAVKSDNHMKPASSTEPEPQPDVKPETKQENPVENLTPEIPEEDQSPKDEEIDTSGMPDYSNNPDPRLYTYNLFGELEPIEKAPRQRTQPRQQQTAPPKPKPKQEVKVEPTRFRKLSKKELELYGSLNWEDNPPINGFYEAMMNIAHAQLEAEAKLRQSSEDADEAPTIEKTEGFFVPDGRSSVKAEPKEEKPEP